MSVPLSLPARPLSRRELLRLATSLGATLVLGIARTEGSSGRERRDLFREGVASGDPTANSVLLWTRRLLGDLSSSRLFVEVAADASFERVIAAAHARVSADSDWTCRALIANLKPAREYWYRFTDPEGNRSRVGRTITAPSDHDRRPVKFAFVSCQNANFGAQNAFRRMIFEDEHAAPADRLSFVLHLGDFIYELVWYPEDRPQGMYDRQIRDIVRYPAGEKISDFHIPVTVDDYRAIYQAYLHDPDIQDARARWPFVTMWDNHEFSWLGWQGLAKFNGITRPFQSRKVAANQAWFEYHPARVVQPGIASRDRFQPPKVTDEPVRHFDDFGLGDEPNNLRAIGSLVGYRSLRWGRHVDLILTDEHSYRSEEPTGRKEAQVFRDPDFPEMLPQEAMEILDAGKAANQGRPPSTVQFAGREVPNFRKHEPPQTILGKEQKAWFLEQLRSSRATWKVWGSTAGTLESRADPQNLPHGLTKPGPATGYAGFSDADVSTSYLERGEIYDFVRDHRISGFVTIAGDRHSFWAGLAAKALPPKEFDPVGIAFITGSISAPGIAEALEYALPKGHPLRPLFLCDRQSPQKPLPAINLLLRYGVESCLEYQKSSDLELAKSKANPHLAPHLAFVDMGGHGYSIVRAGAKTFDVEFVCIPRPVERNATPD
ncbi:MAG: alkaline phosphatase D family protein, partial [Acidobacteriaceae bacterium]|nr:alkaline phosphatase D family protein [Acidobacteriaceae bacterium]